MKFKIRDDKRRFQREQNEAKEIMNLEIQRWSKRYDELKLEKTKFEKETEVFLKNLDQSNVKAGYSLITPSPGT